MLIAAIAVVLGILAHRAHRQRQAVSVIQRAGGYVFYDYEDADPWCPTWLRKLLGDHWCARVTRVNVMYGGLRDDDLSVLSCLNDARGLWLWENPITDQGLANLKLYRFDELQTLVLSDTLVGDAGLQCVSKATELQWLVLNNTKATDAGLAHLKPLSNLRHLRLENTAITDAGLVHLKEMKRLEELHLFNTRVTDAGGLELQKALPNCWVAWE